MSERDELVENYLRMTTRALVDEVGLPERCADCAALNEEGEFPCAVHAIITDALRLVPTALDD